MTNKEYADSLRLIADFYDSHPDALPPLTARIDIQCGWERPSLVFLVDKIGDCKKDISGNFPSLTKEFGALTLRFWDSKEHVCRKVIDGTRKKIEKVPVQFEEKEVEQEIFHWVCPESLLNGDGNANRT